MTWAHYLLQVNIYLVIFYAFYKLLLDKETYFMLNRIYLLSAGLLSLAIPFMKPEWFIGQSANHQFKISADQLNMIMANVTVADGQAEQFNWWQFTTALYVCGTLFFTGRLIYRLFAVKKLISQTPSGTAFSFFRKKVIDHTLPDLDTISRHEETHIRQYHTLDVLFFELLGILVWCNPVIYLYKTTVKNIHEYLADEEAALFQGDKESYSMLLLSKAFGIDQSVLTNSFFTKSLIKKRIFMLNKQRSRKTAILKYGLFLPLFAVMLLLSSATISTNEEIRAVAEKISAPVSLETAAILNSPGFNTVKVNSTSRLKNAGEWAAFYKHVSKAIKYPAIARDKHVQGNTIITFSVSKGEISGISTVSPLGYGCDAQAIKAILGYADFDQVKDGKYSIKIAFRLPDASGKISNMDISAPKGYTALSEITVVAGSASNAADVTQGKVYDFVSITQQPEFPGGMGKFYDYLAKSCRYPEEAIKNHVQGKVFLSFIVEMDGQLSNIKVERSLGSGTDEEAVRMMTNSPKWSPGYSGDQPVRVKYNIPVNFTLKDDKAEAPKSINIRSTGPNAPLYVIDGVIQSQPFNANTVDPNTIESISVLKDATATAAYGDDGKNGVIQINLKKGKGKDVPPAPPAQKQ